MHATWLCGQGVCADLGAPSSKMCQVGAKQGDLTNRHSFFSIDHVDVMLLIKLQPVGAMLICRDSLCQPGKSPRADNTTHLTV